MPRLARQGASRLRVVAATGTVVALGLAGVTAMSATRSAQTAVSAASTTASTTRMDLARRADRPDRGATRPSLAGSPSPDTTAPSPPAPTRSATAHPLTALTPVPSPRPRNTPSPEPSAVGTRYATVALNVRTSPSDNASLVTVLRAGSTVTITGATSGGYRGILHQGRQRFVHAEYLAKSTPTPTPSRSASTAPSGDSSGDASPGVSAAACGSGSSVESGLAADAIRVHRAVCHAFPQITSYGGVRSGGFGEHGSGRALDCMLPNGAADNALGRRVAKWVRAHAGELGVSQVIFDQRIWTVQRSSEGWRAMPDRGGATANHRDHVHVTVRG